MADVREWLGGFRLSRGARHLARDFSDAVLLAELLAQLVPAWVELHNYPSANRVQHKLVNWETLNRKVLVRIKCELSRKQQEDLANAVPGAIDLLLAQVRKQTSKDDAHKANFKSAAPSPSARVARATGTAVAAPGVGLKSPKRYTTESPRSPGPYPLERRPASPSSAIGTPSKSPPKSPRTKRPPTFSLNEFLSAASPQPDQDDIAASFSKILALMSTSGAQSSKSAKPKQAKRAGDTDGRNFRPQQATAGAGSTHVSKVEFAESAMVYFCCHDEPPVRDEQQAWHQHERVQVARFVRCLPSGDCLVQLLKLDGNTKFHPGVKAYVSTPHFIECCGSQLHNIQRIKFDAMEGKWKWFGPESSCSSNSSSTNDTSDASWKRRGLAIDIAPGVRSIAAGPRTEPVRKCRSLHPAVMTKKTSHNSHFFTEVLSRVKCNSISLDEPVAIVGTTSDEGADGTLCADFIQTVHDAIGFDSPAVPTVFPKVHANVALDIPEKKPMASPTRTRKSNAEPVEANAASPGT